MLKTKSATKKKNMIISEIIQVLNTALPGLKDKLGDKKFEKRVKKAAKLLASGIKPISANKVPAKKKIVKKAAKRVNTATPLKKSAVKK